MRDQHKYGAKPVVNPMPQARAALHHRLANNTRSERTATLGKAAKRINTTNAKAKPANANRRSVCLCSARRSSQNESRIRVSAGLSESRLLPVSSLTNHAGNTPTKNGEKASKSDAMAAAARPFAIRPLK